MSRSQERSTKSLVVLAAGRGERMLSITKHRIHKGILPVEGSALLAVPYEVPDPEQPHIIKFRPQIEKGNRPIIVANIINALLIFAKDIGTQYLEVDNTKIDLVIGVHHMKEQIIDIIDSYFPFLNRQYINISTIDDPLGPLLTLKEIVKYATLKKDVVLLNCDTYIHENCIRQTNSVYTEHLKTKDQGSLALVVDWKLNHNLTTVNGIPWTGYGIINTNQIRNNIDTIIDNKGTISQLFDTKDNYYIKVDASDFGDPSIYNHTYGVSPKSTDEIVLRAPDRMYKQLPINTNIEIFVRKIQDFNPDIELNAKFANGFVQYKRIKASTLTHNSCLELVKDIPWRKTLLSDPLLKKTVIPDEALDTMYRKKTLNRVLPFVNTDTDLIQIPEYSHILPPVLDILDKVNWDNFYRNHIPAMFHGDTQIENILFSFNHEKYYFIDPRPSDFGGSYYGDLYYDLAKFYHSIYAPLGTLRCYCPNPDNYDITKLLSYRDRDIVIKEFKDSIKEQFPEVQFKYIELVTALHYLNIASLYNSKKYGRFLFLLGKMCLLDALATVIEI